MPKKSVNRLGIVMTLVVAVSLAVPALADPPYAIEWVRQLGSSSEDVGHGMATDTAGNIFIVGHTDGALGGVNFGGRDAFVSKYAPDGTLVWTRQLGSTDRDTGLGIATDASGDVFITGHTQGALGGANAGELDAFVSKYSNDGILDWTQQLGSNLRELSFGVATDTAGNVFISGSFQRALPGTIAVASDAVVSRFSTEGILDWTQRLEPASAGRDVATDAFGNVFMTGIADNALAGNNDAFVSKYTTEGKIEWTQQLGSANTDFSNGIATDTFGNVFITGNTLGALDGANAGGFDVFVSKYTPEGSLAWTRQLGTSSRDESNGVATDAFGNVFITGITLGSLDGNNIGGVDSFVSKYTNDGNFVLTRQLGTLGDDYSASVAIDNLGNVFITGVTYGDFDGLNIGNGDAFVVKLSVPEPGTAALLALGVAMTLTLRHALWYVSRA